MSTIKSSDEHLTLNADGSSKDIKFQANGVEKASISSSGAFTSTTIDATKLTGNLPAISGASLTGLPNGSQLDHSGTKRLDTNGAGIGIYSSTPALSWKEADGATKMDINFGANATDVAEWNVHPAKDIRFRNNSTTTLTLKSDGRGLSQFTAKAWVSYDLGSGTAAIHDSHNISSITDIATGDAQLNFSNNMANANYAVAGMSDDTFRGISLRDTSLTNVAYTRFATWISSNTTYDDSHRAMAIWFGD